MNENDEGEKIGKPKKKGPMKAYPIYPFHKQVREIPIMRVLEGRINK